MNWATLYPMLKLGFGIGTAVRAARSLGSRGVKAGRKAFSRGAKRGLKVGKPSSFGARGGGGSRGSFMARMQSGGRSGTRRGVGGAAAKMRSFNRAGGRAAIGAPRTQTGKGVFKSTTKLNLGRSQGSFPSARRATTPTGGGLGGGRDKFRGLVGRAQLAGAKAGRYVQKNPYRVGAAGGVGLTYGAGSSLVAGSTPNPQRL